MNTQTTTTENTQLKYTQLKNKLSQFGLSPNEWAIELKKNGFALIRNVSEENFCFIGQIQCLEKSKKFDWKLITLASL
jgi:hypothetical protein